MIFLGARFKALFLLACSLIFIQVASAQGNYTLTLNPTSGPPGTVISISTSKTFNGEICFANGVQTPSNTSYTVPNNASGTISIYCQSGGGEFVETTNTVNFNVTEPDSDGDGIPDTQDACPNQPAQTQNGCPDNQPTATPVPQATTAPQATQVPPTSVPLPALPNDGTCWVATESATVVNVRQLPTLDSDVVGVLDPTQVYRGGLRFDDGENIWYWVDDFSGWVAGYVTRQTDPCDNLPFGTEDGELDLGDVQLASLNLETVLAACPELLEQAQVLPNYTQQLILSAADPCAEARDLIEGFNFGSYGALPYDLDPVAVENLVNNCPSLTPNLFLQLRWLANHERLVYEARRDAIERLGCDVGIFEGIDLDWLLGDTYVEGVGYLLIAHCDERAYGDVLDFAVIYSEFPTLNFIYPTDSADQHPLLRTRWGCGIAGLIRDMGPLTDTQEEFGTLLNLQCGLNYQPDVAAYLHFAEVNYLDLAPVIRAGAADLEGLCGNTNQFMSRFMAEYEEVEYDALATPDSLKECPELMVDLREYRQASGVGIELGDLLSIVTNRYPCSQARNFMRLGRANDLAPFWYEKECIIGTVGSNVIDFVYGEGLPPVNASSEWFMKVATVNMIVLEIGDLCAETDSNFGFNVTAQATEDKICLFVGTLHQSTFRGSPFPDDLYFETTVSVSYFGSDFRIPAANTHSTRISSPEILSSSFYTWIVPENENRAHRIGWAVKGPTSASTQFDIIDYESYPVADARCANGEDAPPLIYYTNPEATSMSVIPDNSWIPRPRPSPEDLGSTSDDGEKDDESLLNIDPNLLNLIDVTFFYERPAGIQERFESDLFTAEEMAIRDFLDATCGIAWEPDGQRLVAYWSSRGASDSIASLITELGADFCPIATTTLNELDEGGDGEVIMDAEPEADPYSGDGEELARIDRGELTEDEQAVRNFIEACGIEWEPDGREILVHIVSRGFSLPDLLTIIESTPVDERCATFQETADGLATAADGSVYELSPERDDDVDPDESDGDSDDGGIETVSIEDAEPLSTETGAVPLQLVEADLPTGIGIIEANVNGSRELLLIDPEGVLIGLTEDLNFNATSPALSPDGNRLAFIGEDADGNRDLFIMDIEFEGELTGLALPYAVEDVAPAWLPDSNQLMVTLTDDVGNTNIYRLNPDDGDLERIVDNASHPSVNPEGRIMAYIRDNNGIPNIYSIVLERGLERPVTAETEGAGCRQSAFGADAFVLYLQCSDALYRYDISGLELVVGEGVTDFAMSPANNLLYYTDGTTLFLLEQETGISSPAGEFNTSIIGFSFGQ